MLNDTDFGISAFVYHYMEHPFGMLYTSYRAKAMVDSDVIQYMYGHVNRPRYMEHGILSDFRRCLLFLGWQCWQPNPSRRIETLLFVKM